MHLVLLVVVLFKNNESKEESRRLKNLWLLEKKTEEGVVGMPAGKRHCPLYLVGSHDEYQLSQHTILSKNIESASLHETILPTQICVHSTMII